MSPSEEFASEVAPTVPAAPTAMRRVALPPPRSPWRSRLVPLAFGFLGVFIGLLLWHLYVDHIAMHQMIQYINLQAPKINKLPE